MIVNDTEKKILASYAHMCYVIYKKAEKAGELDLLKRSVMWCFIMSMYRLCREMRSKPVKQNVEAYGFNNTESEAEQYNDWMYFQALKRYRKKYYFKRG